VAEVTFEPGADRGDDVATIRLTHSTEIFRFCVNLLDDQIQFHEAGRALLVPLREHLTPERFDPMAKSLLGEDRYKRLAEYFERDAFCCACEKNLTGNRKRHPAGGHRAVCSACKKAADRG
jgi:hypothetical protein